MIGSVIASGRLFRGALARLAIALAAAALGACSATPRFGDNAFDATSVAPIELTDVPFFPQTDYECGPAALATILAYAGLPVDAASLAPAVYVEGLRGSLQAELLGATRRHGLVPYPLERSPASLFAEVESGRPVLVLQNLGLPRFPVWHYAVVIGFDAERERVLLRSGTERRRSEPLGRFLRSWDRGDRWAFVAARPDEPPVTASPEGWIRALADAERLLPADAATAAFDAAAERWPDHELVLFAAAAHDAATGRLDAAARRYEALLETAPEHAPARNNLANVLAETGCVNEGLRHARAALDSIGADSPLRAAIEDTVVTLEAAAAGDTSEPAHCRAPG